MSISNSDWKKLDKISGVEKEHRRNEKALEQDRGLDRDLNQKIQAAFKQYQAKTDSHKAAESKEPPPTKSRDAILSRPLATETDGTHPLASDSPKEIKKETHPLNVYRPSPSPTPSNKDVPHAKAASQFVLAPKQPSLAELLVRKSNTPPTPPTKEQTKKGEIAKGETEIPQHTKEAMILSKVSPPVASEAGAKLADATKPREGEVGKKKEKKTEGGEAARGKAAQAAKGREASGGEEKLEAASSGVAGRGSEAFWVADLPALGYTVNSTGRPDENRDYVRERHEKYSKYVEKKKSVEAFLTRALELSQNLDALFEQVKKNIPPKNSYGVLRG